MAPDFRRYRKVYSRSLLAVVLFAVAYFVIRNVSEISRHDFQLSYPQLLYGFLSIVLAFIGMLLVWNRLAGSLGLRAHWLTAARGFFVSQLGKYVPGKIGLYLVRIDAYEGHPKSKVALAITFEYLANFAAGCLLVFAGFALAPDEEAAQLRGFFAAGAGVLLLLLWPRFLISAANRILLWLGRSPIDHVPSYWFILQLVGAYVVVGLFHGLGFYFVIGALTPLSLHHYPLLTAVNYAAGLAGMVAVFAPSGIGVREAVFFLLLPHYVPLPVVIVGVLLARLVNTAVELALAGAFAAVSRFSAGARTRRGEGVSMQATPRTAEAAAPGGIEVCVFGTSDPSLPRNNLLIRGLRAAGVSVTFCSFRVWKGRGVEEKVAVTTRGGLRLVWILLKYVCAWVSLLFQFFRKGRRADCILCCYFGHVDVFLARALGKITGKPVLLDAFLSIHDTAVHDRRLVPPKSAMARLLFVLEKAALRVADAVLLDTNAYIQYFVDCYKLPAAKFFKIPSGADEAIFRPLPEKPQSDAFVVAYAGGYLPLHGARYIVEAASLLTNYPDIQFLLIGGGGECAQVQQLAASLKLPNLRFLGFMPQSDLIGILAGADVCLGAFGSTGKADRVIPTKAYEIMALHKPLISGRSTASAEALIDGENAVLANMADPASLAEAILKLRNDPALRRRIADNAYQNYLENYSVAAIGKGILDVVKTVLDARNGRLRKHRTTHVASMPEATIPPGRAEF